MLHESGSFNVDDESLQLNKQFVQDRQMYLTQMKFERSIRYQFILFGGDVVWGIARIRHPYIFDFIYFVLIRIQHLQGGLKIC